MNKIILSAVLCFISTTTQISLAEDYSYDKPRAYDYGSSTNKPVIHEVQVIPGSSVKERAKAPIRLKDISPTDLGETLEQLDYEKLTANRLEPVVLPVGPISVFSEETLYGTNCNHLKQESQFAADRFILENGTKAFEQCKKMHFFLTCGLGNQRAIAFCERRDRAEANAMLFAAQCNGLKKQLPKITAEKFIEAWTRLDCDENLATATKANFKFTYDGDSRY